MNSTSHYDVAIIGAGMSGLAAGIRLAHFGQRVCIFERHNAVGGLNGFYSIAGRKYDVGLHALTNFVPAGVKGTALGKIFRQLRIDREEFCLSEQKQSRIAFGPRGELSLRFTNRFVEFEDDVAEKFPSQIDGFRKLVAKISGHDEVSLSSLPQSARQVFREYISDPLLEDMLFCPLMYYGSAAEHDMDFSQAAIMFKALFLEGFSRPLEGVRVILRVLQEKYRAAGGERRMRCGVKSLVCEGERVTRLILDDGTEVTAGNIISSAGAPETAALIGETRPSEERIPSVGRLSFVETITVLKQAPAAYGWGDDTIIFFNDSHRFDYARPNLPVDVRSGVICFPNNFSYPEKTGLPEGLWRVTCLANPDSWRNYSEGDYRAEKDRWLREMGVSAKRFLPPVSGEVFAAGTITTDMFTPNTITRFTGHRDGAIYGSPQKTRDGRTPLKNLFLCGTDQGFLGIVGAMLSGISMANLHILQGEGGRRNS